MLLLAPVLVAMQDGGDSSGSVQRQRPVEVNVRQFGVGGFVRPGDWAGVELTVRQLASGQPIRAAVQIHSRDPDGDTLLARREVSLVAGAERAVWIYLPLDWNLRTSSEFTVTVRELPEDASGEEVTVGSQLLATSFLPREVVSATESKIGVVGGDAFGLDQYEAIARIGSRSERVRTGHGEFRVIAGLSPDQMPDRWIGLSSYDTLVWTDGDPLQLVGARADALREWVQRGGHLIVVPETVNPAWFASSNPLADLLPEGRFERREDIGLEQYRHLLLRPQNTASLPSRTVGYVYRPDVESQGYALIEGAEGATIAQRRNGAGLVTVVGLDLRSRALASAGGLRADQFWHRILGQRFLIPGQEEFNDTSMTRRLRSLGTGSGTVFIDGFVADEINRSTAVGVGLLLAIVVFAVYWIVAGPGGFALLKARGRSQYAWGVFVIAAIVFSVIGWIGARALSPVRVSGEHITYIDHVYGEGTQRTRTWVSMLLPDYGERSIGVGDEDDDAHHAIMPWSSPDQIVSVSFPDARQYVMDASDPRRLVVPTRSTVKQFRADWMGGAVWEMPVPPTPQDRPVATAEGLRGTLVHNLPGELTNVTIVLNLGQETESRVVDSYGRPDRLGQIARSRTFAWRKNPAASGGASWAPGEALDLSVYRIVGNERLEQRLKSELPVSTLSFSPTVDTTTGVLLSNWLGLIPGPDLTELAQTGQSIAVQRATHGLDLSKYLASPCLIITGEVADACPTPLRVGNGSAASDFDMTGRTIVRWIYPLEPDPLSVRGVQEDGPSGTEERN